MSPKIKSSLRNIAMFCGAVVAVAGLIAPVGRTVDERYVHRDTFLLVQQGEAFRDSLMAERYAADLRDVKATIARVDSNSQCARKRKPAWCA